MFVSRTQFVSAELSARETLAGSGLRYTLHIFSSSLFSFYFIIYLYIYECVVVAVAVAVRSMTSSAPRSRFVAMYARIQIHFAPIGIDDYTTEFK